MARTFRGGRLKRLSNLPVRALLSLGIAPPSYRLLTVPGRRSGAPHSTPVQVIAVGGHRWLVAPYGEVAWVRNARAARAVTLSTGRKRERVGVTEVGPAEGAPVLRRYLEKVRVARPYFDVTVRSPAEDFAAEAPRHPVFRIQPTGSTGGDQQGQSSLM